MFIAFAKETHQWDWMEIQIIYSKLGCFWLHQGFYFLSITLYCLADRFKAECNKRKTTFSAADSEVGFLL